MEKFAALRGEECRRQSSCARLRQPCRSPHHLTSQSTTRSFCMTRTSSRLRLLPCDVLARVAPAAHQGAPFEVELALRLAEAGCPVAALEPRVEPASTSGMASRSRCGPTTNPWHLERSHPPTTQMRSSGCTPACARSMSRRRTSRTESSQAQQLVASRDRTPALADADRELLGDTLRRLRRAIGERGGGEQLLHGEPHPGNLLSTKNGLLFIDLETCCRGPGRIRPRPCARRGQRALSGRRSRLAARVPDPRAGDDHNVALGSRRPTPERAPVGHRVAQPDPSSARWHGAGCPSV